MLELIQKYPHLLFSFTSIISSLFLFFLLLFQFRSRGGVGFAGVSLAMAVWQFGKLMKNGGAAYSLDIDVSLWSEISFVGAAFIYPCFYHMCCRISLNYKGVYRWISRTGYASVLIFIALELAGRLSQGDRLTAYGYFRTVKPPYLWFLLVYVIYMVMGLFFLYPAKLPNIPHLKNQAKAIFLGALLGFSMGALEFIGVFSEPVYPLSDFSPCVFGGVLYWAIYRYNIIDGGEIVKWTLWRLVYLGMLFLLIGSIYMGCDWLLRYSPIPISQKIIILLYTLVFFCLTPAYVFILRRIRRRFFPVRYSYRKMYSLLSGEFNRSQSPQLMFTKTIEIMESQFGYTHGRGIFFPCVDYEWDYTHFIPLGAEKKLNLPRNFFKSQPFNTLIFRHQILIGLRLGFSDPVRHARALGSLRKINRLKTDFLLPINVEGKLLGLLLFDQKRFRPEPWTVVSDILTSIGKLLGNHVYQYYLLKARTEREHLSRVGMMAATLAHEIKNPLEGIYGAAQIVKEENPRQPKFADIILKDAERLNGVVQRFLQFSSPFDPVLEQFDLVPFLKQFAAVQNTLDPRTPITLLIKDSPHIIRSDSKGIEHILINLIQNAKRVNPSGEKLILELKSTTDHVFLSVEDRGPGVPVEDRAAIFSPFFTSSHKGTGLGLSISKKIAKALGGDLALHPLKMGARFTLDLPGLMN